MIYRVRDIVLYRSLLIAYKYILGLSLKMALYEEPKHAALINDLVIF